MGSYQKSKAKLGDFNHEYLEHLIITIADGNILYQSSQNTLILSRSIWIFYSITFTSEADGHDSVSCMLHIPLSELKVQSPGGRSERPESEIQKKSGFFDAQNKAVSM